MMSRSAIRSVALVCALASCGGSKIQRAATVPAAEAPKIEPAPMPASFGPLARRYIVHPSRSKLEVIASDTILGEHVITFDRWRAAVETAPALKIGMLVEVPSMRMEPANLGVWIQEHILEADRYPQMRLDATMRILDEQGRAAVDAIAEVHGVRRALRFEGVVQREGETFRFRSQVIVQRQDFKLRAPRMVEPFVKDDITITVDAIATPEHVRVEEIPTAEE